jgi:2-iminobutanoate/2-iminopropanoate deaminase
MSRKVTISNSSGMPPYSPACLLDDKYVFISGQVALDPSSGTKELVGAGDISKEATQVLKNVTALLKKSGSSWNSALFVQIFLTDISNYGALNEAYEAALNGCEKPPARACFAVKRLPRGALCEIECIALKDGGSRETIPGNKLFSKAVITDDLVFVAGQLALDPTSGTKELVSKGDPAGEARQALKNVQSILESSGSSMDNVVKVTVLLNSIESYAAVNEAYQEFFVSNPPARAAFEVSSRRYSL